MSNANEINTNLPLTETTYFILLSLASGPRHGYAIMKDVQEISAGRVTLSTGTLYTSLKRLLDQGWIQRAANPDDETNGRGKKAYRLTPLAHQILEAEVRRLQGLVSAARVRRLGDAA